jgi:membrane fusion protein, copper/silver efflux system
VARLLLASSTIQENKVLSNGGITVTFFFRAIPIALIFSSAWAGSTDAEVERILAEYLKLHRVLALDTTEGVDAAAEAIVQLASSTSAAGESRSMFQEIAVAAAALEGKGLEEARAEFFNLSRPLMVYLHNHYSGDGNYYRYFCPMVQKGWVQDDQDVRNPYHGSSMLRCGELVGEPGHGGHSH